VDEGRRPNQSHQGRRRKRRQSQPGEVTVSKILRSQAAYTHSLEVRAQGPALALILEVDAPFRLQPMYSTASEKSRLLHEIASDDRWQTILAAFEMAGADEGGSWASTALILKSEAHTRRLAQGRRIEGPGRVEGT
jgi:hypothetical protein